jgi:hypothetical protein
MRQLMLVGTALVSGIAGGLYAYFQQPSAAAPKPLTGLKLVADMEIERYGDQGARSIERARFAYREDGSWVRETVSVDGISVNARVLYNAISNARQSLSDSTKSKTTYPNMGGVLRPCTEAASAELMGVPVYDRTVKSGSKEAIQTVAPSLNCLVLQEKVFDLNGAERRLIQESRVVSINRDNVPDSLFEVPADYLERSPSEVMALENAIHGRTCAECEARTNKKLDEVYSKSRHR